MHQPSFELATVSTPFEIPDARAALACQDDTLEDFRELYTRAFEDNGLRRTVAVLTRLGARFESAEDLAQAAWSRGWEYRAQLRDPKRLVSWVASIAINMFRDDAVKSRRFSPLTSPGFDPQIAPSTSVVRIDLDRILAEWPTRQRRLFDAVYVQGRSVDEVARSLGISTGAIHHRLSRIRAKLRREMTAA